MKLLEHSDINKHSIDLEPDKQLLYGSISSSELVKLQILNIYIKINLAKGFIWLLKSSARALIFFIQKLDGSFYLYEDYQGLNNLIIKNHYAPSWICEVFHRLKQPKQFT